MSRYGYGLRNPNPLYTHFKPELGRGLQTLTDGKLEMAQKFKDAPIVVGEKVLRDSLNNRIVENFAKRTNHDVHWYHANDRYHRAPLASTLRNRMLRAKSNVTDDAIGMLPLVPGMKVMITDNIAMREKVANGCIGTLQDIKYEINAYNQCRAVCAYVHVPNAKIDAPNLPPDVVPVLPATNTFKYKDENKTIFYISKTQLPLLLEYAFTANKIQRQSLQYALVDLASTKGTQALYVMISHAVCLNNLAIMHWFFSNNVDRRLSEEYREEFDCLKKLDLKTTEDFTKCKWRPITISTPKNYPHKTQTLEQDATF